MAVKEKRGLGIGLDALFGTDLQALSAETFFTRFLIFPEAAG